MLVLVLIVLCWIGLVVCFCGFRGCVQFICLSCVLACYCFGVTVVFPGCDCYFACLVVLNCVLVLLGATLVIWLV